MMQDLAQLLDTLQEGGPVAADQLLLLVHAELRRLGVAKMAHTAPGETLQPTALVNEIWQRLGGDGDGPRWASRAHFFGAAAEAIRRLLIERARRGGGPSQIDAAEIVFSTPTEKIGELLAVHAALDQLAAHDPRKAELVKLRYFAGLTLGETAEVLGLSTATAQRDWIYARAWLFRAISAAR